MVGGRRRGMAGVGGKSWREGYMGGGGGMGGKGGMWGVGGRRSGEVDERVV